MEETARKLNLRKIKSFFEQKTTGGNEALTENENLKTSSSIEGGVGVTWAVTTGTVQCDAKFCVNQSEGVIRSVDRNKPYGWRGGGQLRNEPEDVIGSCVDSGAVWTKGKRAFEN